MLFKGLISNSIIPSSPNIKTSKPSVVLLQLTEHLFHKSISTNLSLKPKNSNLSNFKKSSVSFLKNCSISYLKNQVTFCWSFQSLIFKPPIVSLFLIIKNFILFIPF